MRIGVVSDIHGNYVALDAVLTGAMGPINGWVCLGDLVQGGVAPRAVVERLQALGCPVVMGNTDAFVLTGDVGEHRADPRSKELIEIREWTAAEIGTDGLGYLRTFEPTIEHELHGSKAMHCFHGSPSSFDDVLLPETPRAELEAFFKGFEASLLCGGHIHLQWTTAAGSGTFFNPGSVGLAHNRWSDPDDFYFWPVAQYAVVTSDEGGESVEFVQVPLDVGELERAARNSTHPYADREATRYRPR